MSGGHRYNGECPREPGQRGRRSGGNRPPRRDLPNFRTSEIVKLNVGGQLFTTSRTTLIWINDTFFTGLLSNRIPIVLDENGAVFIDRDPALFTVILNFLRTKNVNLDGVNLESLLHEAEYFGITPLIRRITVCLSLNKSHCGNLLFHAHLPLPSKLSSSPVTLRRRHKDSHRNNQVIHVLGSHNYIAVGYPTALSCYKLGEYSEWRPVFAVKLDHNVDLMAFNSRVPVSGPNSKEVFIAVSSGTQIYLWNVSDGSIVANFDLDVTVEALIFIASGLVALNSSGVIGVWNTMTQTWKLQHVQPITSYDVAGCMLFIGCADGCIYCVDMAKFPLRMKDNDLLVSQLYCDPERGKGVSITALSVYMTPKQCIGQQCGDWIEIAYGTNMGVVRIIFQHPETVGQGPQVLQTFTVHRSVVTRVMLSENHLLSICSESNHVRTWTVTRFRGRILTQPSSTPLASFNVLSLDEPFQAMSNSNFIGPYGEKDDGAVFLQKVIQSSNELFVLVACTGKRLCTIRSVDASEISAHSLFECDSSTRTRMRRYILTGHEDGSIQIWDLTTANDTTKDSPLPVDTPSAVTQEELLRLMNHCDVKASLSTTCPSPYSSHLSIPTGDEDHGTPVYYDSERTRKARYSLPGSFANLDLNYPGPSSRSNSRVSVDQEAQRGGRSPSTTPVNSDEGGGGGGPSTRSSGSRQQSNTLPRRRFDM